MSDTLQSATADELEAEPLGINDPFEEDEEEGEDAEGPDETEDEGGEEAPPEAEEESPAEAEASDEAEAQADDGPADEPAPEPEAPTPSEKPQVRPWTPKADGLSIEIPGAVEAEDFVAIPKESLPVLQRHLANREEWRKKEEGYKRQIEAKSGKEIRAEKVVEQYRTLLDTLQTDQFGHVTPDSAEQALMVLIDAKQKLPILEKEAEIAELRGKVSERKAEEDKEAEERQAAELRSQLETDLKSQISELAKQPDYQGIDTDRAFKRLWKLASQIYFEAPEDIRDEHGNLLVQAGGIGVNRNLILEELQDYAELARQTRQQTQKVAEVAERNARVLAPAKPKPPAVPAKGSPGVGKETPTFKSKDEWEAHIRRMANAG